MLIGPCSRAGPERSTALSVVAILGRLFGRDAVVALEPAAEIELRATRRAEWPILRQRRLAAYRATAGCTLLHVRNRGHREANMVTAPKFQTAGARNHVHPRSRSYGRIAPRRIAQQTQRSCSRRPRPRGRQRGAIAAPAVLLLRGARPVAPRA